MKTNLKAAFYAWSRGISYSDAVAAVDMVDLVEYLFGWDKRTCKEHVDYFVVTAKVKGYDVSETVHKATSIYVPRRMSEIFTRLENNTL